MAAEPPADRCGFTYDVSTLRNVGGTCCWRPVHGDHDRCVFHCGEVDTPREAFEDLAPCNDGERVDGARFDRSVLQGVDWFEACGLIGAEFNQAELQGASFAAADLREANFDNADAADVSFQGANLEDASMVECDVRGANFCDVRLDQAVFRNARIGRETAFGDRTIYEQELGATETARETAQAAIWTYHQIRGLHQDNALPIEARQYELAEKDVRRRADWIGGRYVAALRGEASRWITGYGMSPWRVLVTAGVVVLLSAVLYPTTGGLVETVANGGESESITWSVEEPVENPAFFVGTVLFRSLYFSVVTFTTLGYGDIRPVGDVARTLAGVEAVLGQALLALLVFVLSRRIS